MENRKDHSRIGIELGIITRRWRARMDKRLAFLGLTQAKWVPLRYLLSAGGSMPQRKLVEQTGVEGPSLVRILDGLEKLGLIERRDCDADRRAKTIFLTDKAEPIMDSIIQQADLLREEILDSIPDRDIAVFRKVLVQMLHNMETIAS